MEIPISQRLADEFDDRNVVLQIALGAIALGSSLDALLERWCRPMTAEPDIDLRDEALADFLLGLLAFRGRLDAELARALAALPVERWSTSDGDAPAGPDLTPRELLR